MTSNQEITIKDMMFLTSDQRQVLFNGINVVCKDRGVGYFYQDMEKSFLAFREKGFNLIRFGIFWDGVEPQAGSYDMEYLRKVKEAVMLAGKYGLYVLLDMHQDLFSVKYGDGAPEWATLDEGAYHPADCKMWYEAYLQSEAVIQAADRFWENALATDGIGLLDHYEKMWGMLAEYFADCRNVIGFEPMNEPFMGSIARNAFGTATMEMQKLYPGFDLGNPQEVSLEQQGMFMQMVAEKLQEFDRTILMDFYRRIQKAVSRNSQVPITTGGNIYSSSAVHTGICRLDPECEQQIYSPHGYDSVVDSDRYESFSKENVVRLFEDKRQSQLEMHLPVIVGEWGAFPSRDFTGSLIRHMNGIMEEYLWSSTYWDYLPGMENDRNYDELSRAYPMETAGRLEAYHYDSEAACLEVSYESAAQGVTRCYCPFKPESVDSSLPMTYEIEEVGCNSCYVLVTDLVKGIQSIVISGN